MITDPFLISVIYEKENIKKYNNTSDVKVLFQCPNCNSIDSKSIANVHKQKHYSCPFCSDNISYPNKFIFNLMHRLPVENITREYSPYWAKPYKYDLYFEYKNKSYILEMDGDWHYIDNSMSGVSEKDSKNTDYIKDALALNNNVVMIRIPCRYGKNIVSRFSNIKNSILASKLNEIFDLSNIDFNEINEEALSSIILKVCKDFEYNNLLSYNDIGKKYGIHSSTVSRYIKIGSSLGLVSSSSLKNTHAKKYLNEKVVLLNTGEIFETQADASEKYEIKTNYIMECCNGYKNYIFLKDKNGKRYSTVWRKYNDYVNMTYDEVQDLLNKYNINNIYKERTNDNLKRKIICIEQRKIYNGVNDALRELSDVGNSSLSRACKNIRKTYHGFHWMYYDEYLKLDDIKLNNILHEINKQKLEKERLSKVICLDTKEIFTINQLIDKFGKNNISNIRRSCNSKQRSMGYRWMYLLDYNEMGVEAC